MVNATEGLNQVCFASEVSPLELEMGPCKMFLKVSSFEKKDQWLSIV